MITIIIIIIIMSSVLQMGSGDKDLDYIFFLWMANGNYTPNKPLSSSIGRNQANYFRNPTVKTYEWSS
jgi:hypothetical protein